ncbi:hypothetical protein SEUCBS139899_006771 [Sporothrix eucalyptigena]|uniref:Isochorismatase-like domain-containing protein n=1 Tax=Sporothrix eucalyptigena TaxID=1812306 RepID=A0ABP0CYS4_9PEZI
MTVQTIRSLFGIPPSVPSVTDSVLVLIDTQGEYSDGVLKVERATETRAVIKSLLEKYRTAKGSIIHVVADTPPGAPIFTQGTPLAEILPELTPVAGEPVVHKVYASAFTDTTFEEEVKKTQKKKLVVVGYMAHNCVSSTVRAGSEKGYDVYAVRDAIGDRNIPGATAEELVRISLAEVADALATVIDSKDVQTDKASL